MKKKTKTTKKPAKKKAVQQVNMIVNIRQVDARALIHENAVHVVRLVDNCTPKLLTFNTTCELNEWLFNFDFEHHGEVPGDNGTWIDHIFLDVTGGVFDIDQLEVEELGGQNESDL